MQTDLSSQCRTAKESMIPRMTNSDLSRLTGVSENAIAQFLRGETKQASVYTVAPICAALGVSLDAYFGILPPAPPDAQRELELTREQLATARSHVRRQSFFISALLAIVFLFLIALIIDVCNRNVGWIR